MAVPTKDALLVPYSTNFKDRIVAEAATFNLTPAQAALYTPLQGAFVTAYDAMMAARADGTWSRSMTAMKDEAKAALLVYTRQLYAYVAASESVSPANKILLGIHERSAAAPVARPTERPGMDVVSVAGRNVLVNVHDSASSTKRGKPAGATAAWVYSFVGENYPSDPLEWSFEGAATKAKFEVQFPSTMSGGTQVWLCAAWVNAKQEAGPISVPISTTLQGGGSSSQTMKLAA